MDPVDHARTTRRHAGESVNYGANAPGLILAALAVVALTVGLSAFGAGQAATGAAAMVAAAALAAVATVWLIRTHRKVRDAELRWHQAHSDEPPPPPTS
ncbi:MAG: hypothetical protein PHQ28_16040 [Mycobacterium sp.]|nr:hypothetical protein [Mycobacterium sp.]